LEKALNSLETEVNRHFDDRKEIGSRKEGFELAQQVNVDLDWAQRNLKEIHDTLESKILDSNDPFALIIGICNNYTFQLEWIDQTLKQLELKIENS